MNKYLEAEKRLAELLGWAVVEYQPAYQRLLGRPPKQIERTNVPRWARDWNACGPLMVEHEANPTQYDDEIIVDFRTPLGPVIHVLLSDHPDKETAVRYAIVMAVIAKLEAEKKT